ncbi:4Fe-4S single cluster domain-containing protein [Methylobacterium longum]|uniref:4Fe-4S single cluster domain-containing protein n=1 Tax=Methylobacterium longum TaxID=767694 RepID=A0ABT8AJW8_9HYPH|nr:4Fe-4S single cluster domain-containing protein [Methylobacterium longum]MDN3569861.1 4Fe-4S single cluster domain-containing protein [Methylobacterium longum]GJE13271.1 7-carboxy-7-deazaguanine synthase [Methylobacterium longum]
MTALALSRIHFPITTLGPGKRVGVWFQGCSIRCPGCVSMDTWAAGKGMTTVADVLDTLAPVVSSADGLTISGGEPFEQSEALAALLRGWHRLGGGDVLVYSGRALEDLARALSELDGLIDAVIADPFLRAVPQTVALRGSDNQRLVTLTTRGVELFSAYEAPLPVGERALDVLFDDNTGDAFLVGIPRPGDMVKLAAALKAAGHSAAATEDVR